MGEHEEPARATAIIVGKLERVPALVWCPILKQYTANAIISGIPFVAYGPDAELLSKSKPNDLLRVDATIAMHHWKTGEGKQRTKISLTATKVKHDGTSA